MNNKSTLNQQSKTSNHNQIKTLVKNISRENSTSISPKLVQAAINYSTSPEDARTLMGCLIDTIDQKASHSFTVYKCLFIIEACLNNNNNSQHFFQIAKAFAPDIRLISILSFENKNCPLRTQIHHTALSVYNFLIHSKPISQEQFEAAVIQTFQRPLRPTQFEMKQTYESESEDNRDVWGKQFSDQKTSSNSTEIKTPQQQQPHHTLFDMLGEDEVIEDQDYAPSFDPRNPNAAVDKTNQINNNAFGVSSNSPIARTKSDPRNDENINLQDFRKSSSQVAFQQTTLNPFSFNNPNAQANAFNNSNVQTNVFSQNVQTNGFTNPNAQINIFNNPNAQTNAFSNPNTQANAFNNPNVQMNAFNNPNAQMNVFNNPNVQTNGFNYPNAQANVFPNISPFETPSINSSANLVNTFSPNPSVFCQPSSNPPNSVNYSLDGSSPFIKQASGENNMNDPFADATFSSVAATPVVEPKTKLSPDLSNDNFSPLPIDKPATIGGLNRSNLNGQFAGQQISQSADHFVGQPINGSSELFLGQQNHLSDLFADQQINQNASQFAGQTNNQSSSQFAGQTNNQNASQFADQPINGSAGQFAGQTINPSIAPLSGYPINGSAGQFPPLMINPFANISNPPVNEVQFPSMSNSSPTSIPGFAMSNSSAPSSQAVNNQPGNLAVYMPSSQHPPNSAPMNRPNISQPGSSPYTGNPPFSFASQFGEQNIPLKQSSSASAFSDPNLASNLPYGQVQQQIQNQRFFSPSSDPFDDIPIQTNLYLRANGNQQPSNAFQNKQQPSNSFQNQQPSNAFQEQQQPSNAFQEQQQPSNSFQNQQPSNAFQEQQQPSNAFQEQQQPSNAFQEQQPSNSFQNQQPSNAFQEQQQPSNSFQEQQQPSNSFQEQQQPSNAFQEQQQNNFQQQQDNMDNYMNRQRISPLSAGYSQLRTNQKSKMAVQNQAFFNNPQQNQNNI